MAPKILIIGCAGQIGTALTKSLNNLYGKHRVILADIKPITTDNSFELLDATDKQALAYLLKKYQITEVYLLAALLSATAEKNPEAGWTVNMTTLLNVLELGKEKIINKIFWPSSIAVFGPTSPKKQTPQHTVIEPRTVYGISKYAGELWCQYYYYRYQVDVRSVRFPGLISYDAMPGGGTTDYAVDIFHKALQQNHYECFLEPDTRLPMMYMPDAIRAVLSLMQAPKEKIKERTSYNIAAFDFTPAELYEEIKKLLPSFTISYAPDFRQQIADSWPQSIDDFAARRDWNWQPQYDFSSMVKDMITKLKPLYEK